MKLVCELVLFFLLSYFVCSFALFIHIYIYLFVVVYFKVLGAGGNTFNEIRRKRQKDPMKTVRMRHFLSPVDVMPLTIRILKSGNITVSIADQPPFIEAHDSNVLDINYLSFSYVFENKLFKYEFYFKS